MNGNFLFQILLVRTLEFGGIISLKVETLCTKKTQPKNDFWAHNNVENITIKNKSTKSYK